MSEKEIFVICKSSNPQPSRYLVRLTYQLSSHPSSFDTDEAAGLIELESFFFIVPVPIAPEPEEEPAPCLCLSLSSPRAAKLSQKSFLSGSNPLDEADAEPVVRRGPPAGPSLPSTKRSNESSAVRVPVCRFRPTSVAARRAWAARSDSAS